jgi:hypothetical protein
VDPDRPAEQASGATVRFYRRVTPAVLAEVVSAGKVLPAGVTRSGSS